MKKSDIDLKLMSKDDLCELSTAIRAELLERWFEIDKAEFPEKYSKCGCGDHEIACTLPRGHEGRHNI